MAWKRPWIYPDEISKFSKAQWKTSLKALGGKQRWYYRNNDEGVGILERLRFDLCHCNYELVSCPCWFLSWSRDQSRIGRAWRTHGKILRWNTGYPRDRDFPHNASAPALRNSGRQSLAGLAIFVFSPLLWDSEKWKWQRVFSELAKI